MPDPLAAFGIRQMQENDDDDGGLFGLKLTGDKFLNTVLFGAADWLYNQFISQPEFRREAERQREATEGFLEQERDIRLEGNVVREGQVESSGGGELVPRNLLDKLTGGGVRTPEWTATIIPTGAAIDESRSDLGARDISREGISSLESLQAAADRRVDRGLGLLEGFGSQAIRDTRREFRNQTNANLLNLSDRGFSGSLATSARLSGLRQQEEAVNRINEMVQGLQSTVFNQLSGDALNVQSGNIDRRAAFQAAPTDIAANFQRDLAVLESNTQLQPPGVSPFAFLRDLSSAQIGAGGVSDEPPWANIVAGAVPFVGNALSQGVDSLNQQSGSQPTTYAGPSRQPSGNQPFFQGRQGNAPYAPPSGVGQQGGYTNTWFGGTY